MNATHTHDVLGAVELRGTRRIGGRLVALVWNGKNSQVELTDLTPIRRMVSAPVQSAKSLGYASRGPAQVERSGLKLEGKDYSRLSCSGSSATRQALDYARNIAPEALADLEPKDTQPVLRLRALDRDHNGPKAELARQLRDAVLNGSITPAQGMTLALRFGIEWTSR